jgi:hypothetical protein
MKKFITSLKNAARCTAIFNKFVGIPVEKLVSRRNEPRENLKLNFLILI